MQSSLYPPPVMVGLMCQLARVPSCLIKHPSRCCAEGVFSLTVKPADSVKLMPSHSVRAMLKALGEKTAVSQRRKDSSRDSNMEVLPKCSACCLIELDSRLW